MCQLRLSALVLSLFFLESLAAQPSFPASASIDKARDQLLAQTELLPAQIGILVYDDSLGKTLSNYQDNKYFTPASNTKLFTLYAGLRYLGDSLPGISYAGTDTALFIFPTGDPTLLDPAFSSQPVIDFLKKSSKKIYLVTERWEEDPLGRGWSADDYNEDFSAERSPLPVYGNTIHWFQQNDPGGQKIPGMDPQPIVFSSPEINWKATFTTGKPKNFSVRRKRNENVFEISLGSENNRDVFVPFITDTVSAAISLLKDTLGKILIPRWERPAHLPALQTIFSRPADSVYMPMMWESINFYAEQVLLMAGNQMAGVFNEEQIIGRLLQKDLADLPQQPVWEDGSGASRYNLFSPQDMVTLLLKMKTAFGMDHLKRILPTGGQGTLEHYYRQDSSLIYAKTGSMTGVFCISGYLYSAKNHLLLFSVMINHSKGNGTAIRRDVEQYLEAIRKKN
jgi:serine-type D-Ala-D-Ala carboxypeptidase/endopeptidase (penicillin-binding protein 4)